MISYLFVFIMMVIGGLIGFLADSWGHKIGKKRLSFMGLRPRHTATLVTVGAGVLIPLVTVVIVSVLSSDVRAWLLYGDRAIQESKQLAGQVKDLNRQRQDLNAEIEKKGSLAKALDKRLKETESRLTEFKAKAQLYMGQAQRAAANAVVLTSRLQTIGEQLAARQLELAHAKSGLAVLQKTYGSLQKTYAEVDKQRREANDQFTKLDAENDKLTKQLETLKIEVAKAQAEEAQAESDLAKSKADLAEYQRKLIAESMKLESEIKRFEGLLAETKNQLQAAQNTLNSDINATRTRPMIFSFREEIARYPIDPNRTSTEVENALAGLIRSARSIAEQRGAKASASSPVAGLFPIPTKDGTITVDEIEKGIVKALTGKDENCVLIAYAGLNTFQGEPVLLSVQIFRNPLVYRAGQVIAETRIDGNMSEKAIIDAIDFFVHNKVADKARADKMIPVRGREDSLGSIQTDALLALVKQIRDSGTRIRVRAEATQDTRAADPLKLKLAVRYP